MTGSSSPSLPEPWEEATIQEADKNQQIEQKKKN